VFCRCSSGYDHPDPETSPARGITIRGAGQYSRGSVFAEDQMRRLRFPLALVATASCASSGSSPGTELAQPSERVVAADNHGALRTTVAPNAKVVIPVAPSRVFQAMRAVYEELGIPRTTDDAATGRVGNTNFWKTRKLGNEPISTYLNCGDSIAGPAADNYRVYISLISVVRPDGMGGSEVETAFSAQAQNLEGTTADRVACGTTGRLEERIQKIATQKLNGAN
jgi:hypothetical protein